MDTKKYNSLFEKYSELLPSENIIQIDEGWHQIVEEMLSAIKIYQDTNLGYCNLIPTVFNLIKTNQGWLDIEFCGGDEVVAEIIKFSKSLSFKTCEMCGKMGQLYCGNKFMHWSNKKTLCKTHAVKLFYYTIA